MAASLGWHTVEHSEGPTVLYLNYKGIRCRAIVLRLSASGVLLCSPLVAALKELLEESEGLGFPDVLGPYQELSLNLQAAGGKVSKRIVKALILDFDLAGVEHLTSALPDGAAGADFVDFGSYRGQKDMPATSALNMAAISFLRDGGGRLGAYFTAVEDLADEDDELDGLPLGASAPGGQGGQGALLERLISQAEVTQRAVLGMQGRLEGLGALEARLAQLEAGPNFVAPTPKAKASTAASAPQLFNATGGGLSPEQLAKLQKLAGQGPVRTGDLGGAARVPGLPFDQFGGITEAHEEGEEEYDPSVAPPGATSMEQLLASQTLILQQLVTQRQQSSDPLSALLGSAEEVPKSASVKGIAARQLLVEHFQKRPDRVVQTIKERLATARRKTSPKDLLPGDLWQHFAEAVPLGNHRTLTYVGFIAAKMWEHAERQEHVQLHALVGLLAVFVEQATYDGGGLKLAHLLTGLEEPPFQITELHKAPRTDLHAHGQLSDPRWLATHLAYLRDLDTIQEKASKYGRPAKASNPEILPDPKPKPKWKPKKRGQQNQDDQTEG